MVAFVEANSSGRVTGRPYQVVGAGNSVVRRGGGAGYERSARSRRSNAVSISKAQLRLVETPPHESRPASLPSDLARKLNVPVAGTVLVLTVVFGLLMVLFVSQSGPPSVTDAELQRGPRASGVALAGPGDHLYIAASGDTLWGLATELAPGADPRPVVDRLIEVNGSASIDAGQRLVVPSDLVAQTPVEFAAERLELSESVSNKRLRSSGTLR